MTSYHQIVDENTDRPKNRAGRRKNIRNTTYGPGETPGYGKETAIADMQKEIVKAQQSVEIAQRTADAAVKKAEGDASSLKLQVNAEAEATKMRANAEAEATRARAGAQAEATKLNASAEAERISIKNRFG